MSDCGWCGKVIHGDPVSTIEHSAIVMNDGDAEVELMPAYSVDFCCHGCTWAFLAESHRLYGLSGKDLRTHLIEGHGLVYPPGKPAGGMRRDCILVEVAERLVSVFGTD